MLSTISTRKEMAILGLGIGIGWLSLPYLKQLCNYLISQISPLITPKNKEPSPNAKQNNPKAPPLSDKILPAESPSATATEKASTQIKPSIPELKQEKESKETKSNQANTTKPATNSSILSHSIMPKSAVSLLANMGKSPADLLAEEISKQEHNELTKKNTKLAADLETAKDKEKSLNEELRKATQEKDEAVINADQEKETRKDLQKQIADTNDKLTAANNKLADFTREQDNLTQRFNTLIDSNKSQTNTITACLDKLQNILATNKTELQNALDKQNKLENALQTEKNKLDKETSNVTNLAQANDTLQKKYDRLEKESSTEINRLKQELQVANNTIATNNQTKQEIIDKYELTIKQLQEQNQNLIEAATTDKEVINALKHQITELTNENKTLRDQLKPIENGLAAEKIKSQQDKKTIADLKQQISENEAMIKVHSETIDRFNITFKNTTNEKNNLDNQLKSMETVLAAKLLEFDDAKREFEGKIMLKQQELEQTQSKLTELLQLQDHNQQELEKERNKQQDLSVKNDTTTRQLETQIAKLQNEYDELTKSAQMSINASEHLRAEIQNLKKENSELNSWINTEKSKTHDAEEFKKSLEGKIGENQKLMDQHIVALKAREDEVDESNKKLQQLQNENEALQLKSMQLQTALKEKNTSLEQTKNSMETEGKHPQEDYQQKLIQQNEQLKELTDKFIKAKEELIESRKHVKHDEPSGKEEIQLSEAQQLKEAMHQKEQQLRQLQQEVSSLRLSRGLSEIITSANDAVLPTTSNKEEFISALLLLEKNKDKQKTLFENAKKPDHPSHAAFKTFMGLYQSGFLSDVIVSRIPTEHLGQQPVNGYESLRLEHPIPPKDSNDKNYDSDKGDGDKIESINNHLKQVRENLVKSMPNDILNNPRNGGGTMVSLLASIKGKVSEVPTASFCAENLSYYHLLQLLKQNISILNENDLDLLIMKLLDNNCLQYANNNMVSTDNAFGRGLEELSKKRYTNAIEILTNVVATLNLICSFDVGV
jgi:hypothetical protein